MIAPHLTDDAFLHDVRTAPAAESVFHLWWLGQSGYLLQWGGRRLLLDPYLSDSLSKKYAETDKPHIRMTARVVDPGRLERIAVVTSSHNHTDHLDAETLQPLLGANPGITIVAPEANRELVAERAGVAGDRPVGLVDGGSVEVSGFRLTGVPAAHDDLATDAQGRHRYLGYVIEFGGWTLYHSGDTLLYPGLEERLARFSIDVAMLPINGRAPERRVSGNLWGREAAGLARRLGARLAIPCHYDLFSFNTATPDEFVHACHRLDQAYRVLRAGERWSAWELRGA